MQRSSGFDLEIESSFGRERSAQKGYRAFWLFYRLHFSGFTVKEPRLHFSGFNIRARSATFFGAHGYVSRGS